MSEEKGLLLWPTPQLWPILVFTLLQQTAIFGTRPLISLWSSDLGASSAMIGAIASLFGTGAVLVSLFIGRLVDSIGARFVGQLGCGMMAIAFVIPVLKPSVAALGVSQFLAGIGFVTTILASQAVVAAIGTRGNHATNYSYFATAVAITQLIGPTSFGYLWDHLGPTVPFLTAAVLVVGGFVSLQWLSIGATPEAATVKGEEPILVSAMALLRTPVLSGAILSGALVQFCQDALLTFFPLYTRSLGMTATATGIILSVRSAATLSIRPFMATLVRRFGEGPLLIASLISGGVVTAALGIFHSMPALLLTAFLVGTALGLAMPMTMAAVADIAPSHLRGMAFSLRMTGNRLGQMLSPLVLGLFAGPAGPAVVIWISGGLLATGGVALGRTLIHALGGRPSSG